MLIFQELNGISVDYEDEDLIQEILKIAAGSESEDGLRKWLGDHILQFGKALYHHETSVNGQP